jgi:rsbT co-antagonist protein RsbR
MTISPEDRIATLEEQLAASQRIIAQLEMGAERLRLLIASVPIVIYALDLDGVFTLSDGKGLQALGLNPGQVVGQSAFTLYADFPDIIAQIRRALSGETFTVISHVGTITFETSYAPLRDSRGEMTGVLGIATDITDRLAVEADRLSLQEDVIQAQQAAIRELSTPLIPLAEGVVVMPLVGTIDTRRAQQIMEVLLEGIASHQAEVVLLDISGVRVVDTQVADALLRAARAVQLLGARVVLTGISAEVAQTIVHLGADMSQLVTKANLQAGLRYVLEGDEDALRGSKSILFSK